MAPWVLLWAVIERLVSPDGVEPFFGAVFRPLMVLVLVDVLVIGFPSPVYGYIL